jgi:ABC-type branched-subunit amino acid transport system substrate-binding protein
MHDRRTRLVGARMGWLVVLCTAALAVPLGAAGASAPSGKSSGPVVKVGMLAPITSPTAANPDQGEAFKAAVAAFNKRGGLGTNGARMEAVVCDTKGDANGEVGCARKLVSEGVVATVNDLAYNNPAGVDEVLQNAGIPRIGLGSTGVGTTSLSFPLSTGIVGAYMGDAVGFKNRGKTKVVLVRTDAATGAGFADFLRPYFKQAGVDIVGDVEIATGSTDYAPYVAQIQRSNPDAVLLAIDDTSAAQLIAAMQQLNYKPLLGGHPGTFTLETLQKFKDNTTGTLLAESFPYPSLSNVKTFPALKQFFADMKASKQKILDPKNIQPTSLYPWVSTLAFVNALKDTDTVTKDSVIQALRTGQDIDLMGLAEPWTPSAPGFSVFGGISNPYVYVSKFDGKNVITEKQSIDVSQYFK